MCTYATESLELVGSGKVAGAWAPLARATVYVDHPYTTPLEHTMNIDLFEPEGPRAMALELSIESARALREAITCALSAVTAASAAGDSTAYVTAPTPAPHPLPVSHPNPPIATHTERRQS